MTRKTTERRTYFEKFISWSGNIVSTHLRIDPNNIRQLFKLTFHLSVNCWITITHKRKRMFHQKFYSSYIQHSSKINRQERSTRSYEEIIKKREDEEEEEESFNQRDGGIIHQRNFAIKKKEKKNIILIIIIKGKRERERERERERIYFFSQISKNFMILWRDHICWFHYIPPLCRLQTHPHTQRKYEKTLKVLIF